MAAGASVVLHDIDGNSALHLACMSRNEDVAQYILKHLDPPEPDHQAEHIVNSVNNRKETYVVLVVAIYKTSIGWHSTFVSSQIAPRRVRGEEEKPRGRGETKFGTQNDECIWELLLSKVNTIWRMRFSF